MTIAKGIYKQLRFKKESTLNTAPGDTGAQLLRRVTSDLSLNKNTYESQEKRSDQQVSDFRHGTRSVGGNINGELSLGTYQAFMQAVLRRDFTTGATTGAVTTIDASTSPNRLTRASGSYITDGFKVGDVVRVTGFTAPADVNNGKNLRITALTATVMTVSEALTAKTAGDTVTVSVTGKKTWVPLTAHTDDSFWIEHWHDDINQSEQFGGCKPASMSISMPATGMATIDFTMMGVDMTTDTSEYYTSPTAETTTAIMAAVNGTLRLDGADIALITSMEVTIDGGLTTTEVVGSNKTPDVFQGRVNCSGQFTALFESGTIRDEFLNEGEVSLNVKLDADSTGSGGFLVINMGRLKINSATGDDPETQIVKTYQFKPLLDTNGGPSTAYEKTTISIQDSSL